MKEIKQTNVAFYMKLDTPHCVCVCVCVHACVCVVQFEIEAGVGGRASVACRPTSAPCGPKRGEGDMLDICVCMCVCVCVRASCILSHLE